MAIYQGRLSPDVISVNAAATPQYILDGVAVNHVPNIVASSPALFNTGLVKNHPYSYIGTTHQGYWAKSYADIFFNKILIEPLFVSVGIVATEKVIKITVSNLFLAQPKQLSQITGVNTTGMDLVGKALPYTLAPLETIEYDLSVKTEGPPIIDTQYTFLFAESAHNRTVDIVGNRIVVFPYWFKPGMTEKYEWSTGIIKSRNGKEQRIRNRLSPRISMASESYLSIGEIFRAANLLNGWKGKVWALPLYHEARHLSQPLAASAKVVSADTSYGSFVVGGLAMIFRNQRIFDAVEISEILPGSIELTQGVQYSYDVGDFLIPVQNAIMSANPKRRSTGHDGYLETKWSFLSNLPLGRGVASATQYRGKDVLLDNVFEILSPDDIDTVSYSQRMDIIDFNTSKIDFVSPEKYITAAKTVRFIVEGLGEIWRFKEWLKRVSGKWSSFWMPTFEPDFTPTDLGILGSSITTREDSYISHSLAKNHAIIFFKDGTHAIKEITGADVADNGTMEVSFDSPINQPKEKIKRISLLTMCRFDTDQIELEWYQGFKIICDIPIREIKPNDL